MTQEIRLKDAIQEKYGAIAKGESAGCCGGGTTLAGTETLGYNPEQIAVGAGGADLGLGCGNPIDLAELKAGETVLDLGAGAGFDCLLAAKAVGESGTVLGVDFTLAMIEKAQANAEKMGVHIDFRFGEIENLPVESGTVDAVISNCVINLSQNKPRAFTEAFRVLKRGGRLAVSDIVLGAELPAIVRESVDAYVGCVAGALLKDEYLRLLSETGFERIEVLREVRYTGTGGCLPEGVDEKALTQVLSLGVRAYKP